MKSQRAPAVTESEPTAVSLQNKQRATVAPAGPDSVESALIALIGNPNTGKTSVFNLLTGGRHRVANYPGVTVEKVTGRMRGGDRPIEVVDLPGTYSLAARSPDESIVVDTLLGRQAGVRPLDAALVVVDAANLERNLYLTTQLIELEIPVVVIFNMIDIAEHRGLRIDAQQISRRLGAPVVSLVARTGRGLSDLIAAVGRALDAPPPAPVISWPEAFESAVDQIEQVVCGIDGRGCRPSLCEIRRGLIDVGGSAERRLLEWSGRRLAPLLAELRQGLQQHGLNLPDAEAQIRYDWIAQLIGDCVTRDPSNRRSRSDRVDDVLTHRVAGSIIFVAIMATMFMGVFAWAAPLMDLIDDAFARLSNAVSAHVAEGVLASFLTDGIIAGVGGVLVFLPQILILFVFITILEDCGYLARAAFLVDRVFRVAGLGGASFVPLLSSFACAVPGIMATRTIPDSRHRIITMVVAPLMSCSARIPVYTIMVAAFVPRKMLLGVLPLQGLVFASMYMVGIVVAAGTAALLKRFILRGEDTPFLIELPGYKMPSLGIIAYRLYDRGKAFVVTAGTIILAMSIIIWALLYFPRPASLAQDVHSQLAQKGVTDEQAVDNAVAGAYLRQSVLGRAGRLIEPAVEPLGWDWRIGLATLAAFPAREVIISTLGIIYNLSDDINEDSALLRDRLHAATWPDGRKVYSLPVALSIMVFFALCCQCQATLAVIKRESNSWRWPIFTFTYMTVLAYVGALLTYQVGSMIAGA